MHRKHTIRRALIWGLIVTSLLSGSAANGQPPPPAAAVDAGNVVVVPVQGRVSLESRKKKRIRQVRWDEGAGNLMVQPDAANPNAIILTGVRSGFNRVTLVYEDKTEKDEDYDVIIQNDIEMLRAILRRAVPTANIDVIPFGRSAVLTGNVAHAEDVTTVLTIANSLIGGNFGVVNALNVGGVQQVQLDVTVARVDRTKTRSRGFNFIINGTTVSGGSVLGGLTSTAGSSSSSTASSAGVGIIPSAVSAVPTSVPNIIFGVVPAQLQTLLQALKTEGLAKTLAEPKLVTQSGRPARILSGGQQAVLSSTSGINGPGVSFQDIGTELDFLPIVYGNGKIYLEVAPRVRAVNTGLGITTSFGTVPGFDEQSVRTSVVMESGQTFAIGGLIQTDMQASTARVPVLGEIPFLSFFFSQIVVTEQEQELVILVTPHLVDPMDCNQVPKRVPGKESRSPDDFELYLETMLELPRGQRNIFEGNKNLHYKAAWKNDPTAVNFPCGMNPNVYRAGSGGGCANGQCAPTNPRPTGTMSLPGASPGPQPLGLPMNQQLGKPMPMNVPTQLPGSLGAPMSQPGTGPTSFPMNQPSTGSPIGGLGGAAAMPSSDGFDSLPNSLTMPTGPRTSR
jgi:pilus assembly protein CpaC